jgi:hypothetical protein
MIYTLYIIISILYYTLLLYIHSIRTSLCVLSEHVLLPPPPHFRSEAAKCQRRRAPGQAAQHPARRPRREGPRRRHQVRHRADRYETTTFFGGVFCGGWSPTFDTSTKTGSGQACFTSNKRSVTKTGSQGNSKKSPLYNRFAQQVTWSSSSSPGRLTRREKPRRLSVSSQILF